MTKRNVFGSICGAGVAALIVAAPVQAQPTATRPIEVAAVADFHLGALFPPATLLPGVAVTLPRGQTTAVELFVSVGRGAGVFLVNKRGVFGPFGNFGVQLKRFHGNEAGDFRTFHTFGLLGVFGLSTPECCVEEGLHGNVIRDTTTTSMGVVPPILPFLGIGFDRRLRRARLRVEVDSGIFDLRGTIAVAFPLTSRP